MAKAFFFRTLLD